MTTSLSNDDDPMQDSITAPNIDEFLRSGFQRFDDALAQSFVVDELNEALERVLHGHYDRGIAPDKMPAVVKDQRAGAIGFSGSTDNIRIVHLINVWHADNTFARLVLCSRLGSPVATLAGWQSGARVAQDQVWAKPPGAPPVVFHRDSPYFFFSSDGAQDTPCVMTAWVALDDMDEELGPLEYVVGSHSWDVGRAGSPSTIFQQEPKSLLLTVAARIGLKEDDLDIVSMRGLSAGGLSVHHGCCWHGSGPNFSSFKPRRGIGIHYAPGSARFTEDPSRSRVWSKYIAADGLELNPLFFPIVTEQASASAARCCRAEVPSVNSRSTREDKEGLVCCRAQRRTILSATERKRFGQFVNCHRQEWNDFVQLLGRRRNCSFKMCSRDELLGFHADEWRDRDD